MTSEHRPVDIAAMVAAAGLSRRMGAPKQLLPWGESTVIATVVCNLAVAGAEPVVCVVGHLQEEMAAALRNTPAQIVYNPAYVAGEMLSSCQAGIQALQASQATLDVRIGGLLVALADQPHIPITVLRQVIDQARSAPQRVVIPSYQKRRGHPFYLPARLWPEVLALTGEETLRDLVNRHSDEIVYVNVNSDAILRDMDTPADYDAARREHERPKE